MSSRAVLPLTRLPMLSVVQAPHPLCVGSISHSPSSSPSNSTASARSSSSPASASDRSLAATYAAYVVRVHTRHGIKTLSFDVLAALFTSTAKRAAEELGISSRTLIRVCRSLGIRRWPYLGFRSEKNVERIRQEAIDNLRRKLQRDGPMAATTVLDTDNASVRGASAKRLLHVQLPVAAAPPPTPTPTPTPEPTPQPIRHSCALEARVPWMSRAATPFVAPPASLTTPPPTHQRFNLDGADRISPRKPQLQLQTSSKQRTVLDDDAQRMPSLHLLVDASILTAFKHEAEAQYKAHDRTKLRMSMRDILATTRATATTTAA